MPARKKPAPAKKPAKALRLGGLPEWDLADLYAGIDDPQVKRDLDRAGRFHETQRQQNSHHAHR